ncbi:40S ribosomal protein S5-1 [Hordeum vulgare]|nr:40S ribosomal protein S5-1 [Hordeum vulgare]
MTSPKIPKDKILEKVINPYLTGVLQHPQSIEMRGGMLHIRDVEGPKKTGSMEARLEAMEQQVFKCQGMVERGLNANHMMITEFTTKHRIDANDIGKHLSRLYDMIDHLHAQIYDLQNQNYLGYGPTRPPSPTTDLDHGKEAAPLHKSWPPQVSSLPPSSLPPPPQALTLAIVCQSPRVTPLPFSPTAIGLRSGGGWLC